MNYHRYFAGAKQPVETCVIGSGSFGRSFLAQGRKVPLMRARVAVDVDAKIAAEAFKAVGIASADIAICATVAEAEAAWNAGQHVAASDLATVIELPIDVVLEATGHPEAGARHARMAVEAGRHLVMVSKEVESVVGPGLARKARLNKCIVTPVDGDQPSLLIGLVTWAEVLGFTIVAAGKSSEYDFVFDASTGTTTSNNVTVPTRDFATHWTMGSRPVDEIVAARSREASALQQRTVPDLCEMLIVGNATGLTFDRADFHAPLARIAEVPTMFATKANGGLLSGERRLDVFNCLRTPDEISFAGGVFVIVTCDDETTWRMLEEKGHVLSRTGATAMLWLPRHLLGLEAATSVLEAAVLGRSSGADEPQPHLDLCGRADADISAGTVLTASGHHHSIENVSGILAPGAALSDGTPIPYYLMANRRLVRPIQRGGTILCGDVELDETSVMLALRREQDAAFFGTGNRSR
jgi:predicted homoserine dehydrogenase-like protein